MARKKKITNEQLIDALHKNGGIYTYAAEQLGITMQAIQYRIKTDEKIAEACQDACEQTLDLSEHELIKLIKAGNLRAIIFYLKMKGKKRGYTEKGEPVDTEPITAYIKYES